VRALGAIVEIQCRALASSSRAADNEMAADQHERTEEWRAKVGARIGFRARAASRQALHNKAQLLKPAPVLHQQVGAGGSAAFQQFFSGGSQAVDDDEEEGGGTAAVEIDLTVDAGSETESESDYESDGESDGEADRDYGGPATRPRGALAIRAAGPDATAAPRPPRRRTRQALTEQEAELKQQSIQSFFE
jgi:hypothetical protein